MDNMRFTPDWITKLEPNEVFVFGSNLAGMHGGGAALLAYDKFGAEWGKGEGLQGQSYAIPTMQGGVETVKPYVLRFIDYAALHPDLIFLVTKIGCGIAGFREEEIAPLFASAVYYPNIILPESFVRIIHDRPKSMPSAVKDMIYGQTRTLVDILREMDKEEPITNAKVASERLDRFFSKNLRGDETGFNSMRAVWCILSAGFSEAGKFDVDKFEKKLLDFDKGRGEYWNRVEGIYFRYCTSKIIRYVSFLNSFRRYKTADELREDLMKTVQVSSCGDNPRDYFFSLAPENLWMFMGVLREHEDLFSQGRLDTDLLQKVFIDEPKKKMEEQGLEKFIRENYSFAGCHPDLLVPKEWTFAGPTFRVLENGELDRLCNGSSRLQRGDTDFEARMAIPILESDPNYMSTGEGWWRVFVPVSDYSLPVIDAHYGIISFKTMEEKKEYIESRRRNAD